jgi:hypothetical protein
MAELRVTSVEPRIYDEKTGQVYAGFVNFENPDDEDDFPRLTFHNVEGVQKDFSDGTLVNPAYVKMAEEALDAFFKKNPSLVLAPAATG